MYVYYCLDLVKSCVRGRGDNGHVLRLAAACVEVVSQEEEEGGGHRRGRRRRRYSAIAVAHMRAHRARENSLSTSCRQQQQERPAISAAAGTGCLSCRGRNGAGAVAMAIAAMACQSCCRISCRGRNGRPLLSRQEYRQERTAMLPRQEWALLPPAAIAFLPAVCGGQTSSDRVVLR